MVPKVSSITFEGIVNQHYFDTGLLATQQILETSFTYGLLENDSDSVYLSIGLNSVYDNAPPRKALKCVFLLDISGSMNSTFDYSQQQGATKQSKLDVAKQSLLILANSVMLDKDSISILAFDTTVDVVQEMANISTLNKQQLQEKLSVLQPRGGTEMFKGISHAFDALDQEKQKMQQNGENLEQYEFRVIVLTDMNTSLQGETNKEKELITQKSMERTYMTYIAIGLDADSKLANDLADIRGSNYFAVDTEKEFKKKMELDFDYLVCPIVFDVAVNLVSPGFKVEKVYGVPGNINSNLGPTRLMNCATMFPSPKDTSSLVKGGIILVHLNLQQQAMPATVDFETTFTDFSGANHVVKAQLNLDGAIARPYYQNTGVEKALVCMEYVNTMHAILGTMKKFSLPTAQKQVLRALHDKVVAVQQRTNDPSMGELVSDIVALLNAPDAPVAAKQ